LIVIDAEQASKISLLEQEQKSQSKDLEPLQSPDEMSPSLDNNEGNTRGGHRRQRMSVMLDIQTPKGEKIAAKRSLNVEPSESPSGDSFRQNMDGSQGRMSPRLSAMKTLSREETWSQHQSEKYCIEPESLPKPCLDPSENEDENISSETEEAFTRWYGTCDESLEELSRKPKNGVVVDEEGRRPLHRVCLGMWKPPLIDSENEVANILTSMADRVNEQQQQPVGQGEGMSSNSSEVKMGDQDPISYWLMNFFDPYEVGLHASDEAESSKPSSERPPSPIRSSSSKFNAVARAKAKLPPRALPSAYEEAALTSISIIKRLEAQQRVKNEERKLSHESEIANSHDNRTDVNIVLDTPRVSDGADVAVEASLKHDEVKEVSPIASPSQEIVISESHMNYIRDSANKLPLQSLVALPEDWVMGDRLTHWETHPAPTGTTVDTSLTKSSPVVEEKKEVSGELSDEQVLKRAGLLLRTCAAMLGLDLRIAPSMQVHMLSPLSFYFSIIFNYFISYFDLFLSV
jgi:hypothetical protein